MDFSISPQVQALTQKARDFVERELIPIEAQVLTQGWTASADLLEQKRQLARHEGLWAAHMPQDWGGGGLPLADFAHLSEALGRSPLGHFTCNCQAPDAGNMELLLHFGTPAQQERWLRPLVEGKLRSCFSMTEPDQPGSNPVLMDTTAQRRGDHYLIQGRKWFTTAADGADFAICMAVTDPDAKDPYARASQLIVPTHTPGFDLIRNIPIMGEAGDGFLSHAEVHYNDCAVPAEHLLGPQGAGFLLAQSRLGPGRIHHCMRWIGICERAFDLMCQRAATRLIPRQTPRHTADHPELDRREPRRDRRRTPHGPPHRLEDRPRRTRTAARERDLPHQVLRRRRPPARPRPRHPDHGARGITDDTPLAFWFRHERAARIYDGPDEVHKGVIARRELRARGMSQER
jgi:acyl-CoA dehydrogenase